MLRLTKKADYGVMALKYLAEQPPSVALSAKDIAEAYHIPQQLLAKVLQRLAKVGLVRSTAGINGGYALSRDAGSITVFEVIAAVDGPLFLTACSSGGARACDLTDSCTIKEPMARVNDSIVDLLRGIRIGDLVDRDPRHAFAGAQPLVSIRM